MNPKDNFQKKNKDVIQAFIFDLDGTLYLGDRLIPGADKVLNWVRENKFKVRFLTNNPRYSRKYYVNKLNHMGIYARIHEVVTSGQLTAEYLKKNENYGKIFVIGEKQLHHELLSKNILVVNDSSADTVLVSFDTTLTYEKLLTAFHALNNGAHFLATNPDYVCPTAGGGLIDAGAIIAALESSTNRKIEKIIGKPSSFLGNFLLKELNLSAHECVMVGDRLNTDICFGNKTGMKTVWINITKNRCNDDQCFSDHIISAISDLPKII